MSRTASTREDEISRVAIGVYDTMFRASRDHDYRPREGTVMHELWQRKRLTQRHAMAWHQFCLDLDHSAGKSGSVVSSYGDAIQSSNAGDFRPPVAFANRQYIRLQALVDRLTREEYTLLGDLTADYLRHGSELATANLGMHRNGFSGRDQAHAAGVAIVTCLMDRIADFYQISRATRKA